MARIGELIEGKYEVLSLIGEGGMSRVYLVRDQRLNKLWAVKEIGRTAKDANNTVVVQSLIAEANLMKRLDHPALPRIVDIIQTEQTIYVVMDYVEGESLNKVLRRVGHAMPQEDVIDWGIQLCDALGYLHSRKPPIIYRDMKPGNIMLNDEGTVKLIDFGIAREYKEDRTSDTMILGTRGYAAPEQFSRTAQTDARTDIYSLGVTLHHLVTGRAPSEDTVLRPIREINPQLSEGLEYIITKATQADPARRYQSCAEMSYDLEHYDQLTAGYRREQKKKLRTFNALWIGAIVCAVLGAACIAGSFAAKSSTYNSLLTSARVASTEGSTETGTCDASELYEQAIEKEPSNITPYLELITEVYGDDETFSQEEATSWSGIYRSNVGSIESDSEYAELCYKVGMLYLLSYEYDEGDAKSENIVQTAASEAAVWFDRALESAESQGDESTLTSAQKIAAETYSVIGSFYDNLNDRQADATEVYTEYWEQLEAAVDTLAAGEADDTLRLRLYYIVYCAIENEAYLRNFKACGVTQEQAEELLGSVLEETAELSQTATLIEINETLSEAILEGVDADDIDGTKTQSDAWKTIQTVFDGVTDSANDTMNSLGDGEADA